MATSHSLTTHCQTTLIKTLLASTVTHTDQRPELSYTPTYKMLAKRKKTYTLAWKWKSLSHVRLLVTPWTIQCKEFSRPEYWSIPVFQKPFPSPGDLPNPGIEPRSPILQVDSLPAEPQGKPKNTGVGSLSLLQWIFLTQKWNWGLLHCRQIHYQLSYQAAETYILITYRRVYRWVGDVTLWGHHLWPLDQPCLKGNLPMGQWSLSQLLCFT